MSVHNIKTAGNLSALVDKALSSQHCASREHNACQTA